MTNLEPEIEIVEIGTTGDRIVDVALSAIGDKGLFTKELDAALLEGRIDMAVHSLKDLPTLLTKGLSLAAVVRRSDPWDVFVAGPTFAGRLHELPPGASIATSSLRRGAQLLSWREDLEIVPVRGNVETRLRRLSENKWEGMILAEAGLKRLDLASHIRERIPRKVMLPAVGQGAIAVVARADDHEILSLLDHLDHKPSRLAAMAERAFLRRLEGGCQVPIGAYAEVHDGDAGLSLEGCVASLDGRTVLRDRLEAAGEDPEAIGIALAEQLISRGASRILSDARRSAVNQPSSFAAWDASKSVILFRSPEEDDRYVAAFRSMKWDVECIPLLEYSYENAGVLADRLKHPDHYAAVALTSPRAVDAIASNADAYRLAREGWAGKPAYAVGPETARRAARLGLQVLGESSGNSGTLADLVAEQPPKGALLFLSGTPRRSEFTDKLTGAGINYEELIVYRSHVVEKISLTGRRAEWVVFFSPRGVRLAEDGIDLDWSGIKKAAIGPTTAEAIKEAGWPVDAVADSPSPNALVTAILAAQTNEQDK